MLRLGYSCLLKQSLLFSDEGMPDRAPRRVQGCRAAGVLHPEDPEVQEDQVQGVLGGPRGEVRQAAEEGTDALDFS